MKRILPVSFVFILLLCASPAFSQQREPVLNDGKSKVSAAPNTRNNDYAASSNSPANDQYGTQLFPTRGGSVDWGLALSGGGIRSAAFSIGAMKALYDKGIMRDIDVISSVSGGGYASYWLLTNYAQNKTQEFGEAAFNNHSFIKNSCRLQNKDKSNPVPTKSLLKIIFKRSENAFNDYEEAIFKSFGNNELRGTTLNFLDHEIADHKVPFFIFNTTLRISNKDLKLSGKDKEKKLKRQLNSVFEITPKYRGNPHMTFSDWTKESGSPTLSQSVAMSGAPKWKMARPITNFNPGAVQGKDVYLSDGGHSENLAALALIRRGVKNVIIVDAEQDPTYGFGAYVELQKMLKLIDIKVCVPEIENFLKKPNKLCTKDIKPKQGKREKVFSTAVSLGRATSIGGGKPAVESTIYYVKMSKPEVTLPEKFSDDAANDKGQLLADKREKQRLEGERRGENGCDNINLDFKENGDIGDTYENLYINRVGTYSYFLNNLSFSDNRLLWTKLKLLNAVGKVIPFFSYNFPHTTSADQSLFSDQLEAFVGLGYLQTMELKLQPNK